MPNCGSELVLNKLYLFAICLFFACIFYGKLLPLNRHKSIFKIKYLKILLDAGTEKFLQTSEEEELEMKRSYFTRAHPPSSG